MTIDLIAWRLVRRPVIFLGALGLAIALGFLGLFLAGMVTQASHSTFTVNSTGDAADASAGDGTCETATAGECTLRAAIEAANDHAGADTIAFNIPGVGPHTISPGSALPTITDPVIIDGYTQSGATPNTNGFGVGTNTVLKIELDGSSAGVAHGLVIGGSNSGPSTIKGLVINSFVADGIRVGGNGGNTIEGNFIGTNVAGDAAKPNLDGVVLSNVPNNTIGGTQPETRNLILGSHVAVDIRSALATNNFVQGNFIGTNAAGTLPLGGGGIAARASFNTIGGTASGAGNLISGVGTAIGISGTNYTVQGNYIGTDVTGMFAIPNANRGIFIHENPGPHTIGGTTPAARNVISGSGGAGIAVTDQPDAVVIQGNYIGTDKNGTAAVPNFKGIDITGSDNHTIGGTDPGAGNVISGNTLDGIEITGQISQGAIATGSLVQGNLIGTQADGVSPLGNGRVGVAFRSWGSTYSEDGVVGLDELGLGKGNVIAFNGSHGVLVSGADTVGHTIRGNSIHSNGGMGIETVSGGNTQLAPPTITAVGSASGTACPNCIVDVYSDSSDEGEVYHGSTTADGFGDWSFFDAVVGPNVTATATDASGNTSEFSVPAPFLNTTVGGVPIPLDDGVTLTFSTVTGGGTTTVTTSTAGPPPPTGLKITGFTPPVYIDINTTATFSGLVTVCIAYDGTGLTPQKESKLTLKHFDGGWSDITSSLDTINDIICGETATLSPFAIMVPVSPSVGGIVELRTGSDSPASAGAGSGSSASLYAAVVGAIAAGSLLLAAGGVYVRRRRVG